MKSRKSRTSHMWVNEQKKKICVSQRVWWVWLWNWYEIVNLLMSAFGSPEAPYAMLSGTIYQFVPSFTVHPPLLLTRKLNGYNKMAIYPLEWSHTPRGKAFSVSLDMCAPVSLRCTAWNLGGEREVNWKWWDVSGPHCLRSSVWLTLCIYMSPILQTWKICIQHMGDNR